MKIAKMAGDKPKSSKGEGATTIDSNSPYYIHSLEYPKQMHVNDTLTYKNYND